MWIRPLAGLLILLALTGALAQENEFTRRLGQDIINNQQLLEATRAEIAQLDRELADLSAEISAQLAERERLSRQIAELQGERARLTADIDALRAQIADTGAKIETEQARLEALKGRLSVLLVNLYKGRGGRVAGLLAEVASFHELQVKNHYLSLLTDQQVAVVEEVNQALARLAELQASLTAQVDRLRAQEAELRATQAELESGRAALGRVIAELQASEEGAKAARRENLQAQRAFLQAIDNLEATRQAEINRLRQEAEAQRRAALAAIEERQRQALIEQAEDNEAAAAALAAPLAPVESDFILPVTGARLASPFGGQNASGIVLRAEQRYAEVRAAMSGVVTQASFFQANTGHIVIIAHGPDLITAYLNLQPPLVEVGDQVSQGQVLGYLGGGSLVSPDALFFYVATSEGRDRVYRDPAPMLGFR